MKSFIEKDKVSWEEIYIMKKVTIRKFVSLLTFIFFITFSIFSTLVNGRTDIINGRVEEENYTTYIINQSKEKSALMSPPDIEWNMTYGGEYVDLAYSVQQTNDGGYIATGYTSSYGNGGIDVWLVKIDTDGAEQWNITYGTASSEAGYSVQQTSDNGYIITGYVYSSEGTGMDLLLLKTDQNGKILWNRTLGGNGSDMGYCVKQAIDGGYIVTGRLTTYQYLEDVWLIKTNENGSIIWDKTFGKLDYRDVGYSLQQTFDGGYIITGYTYSYGGGGNKIWLIKTDGKGNELWNKTFNGNIGVTVKQTKDGGYVFVGYTTYYGNGSSDIWLVKTDGNGKELWNRTYGGISSEIGCSVQQLINGGYILTGYTYSYGAGSADLWLIKTDSKGMEIWNRTYGGSSYDIGYSLQLTSDRGYIVAGYTYSFGHGSYDMWLLKTESENQPPMQPRMPDGPAVGHIDEEYTYTTNTTDPEMDDIYYMFDWGDGNFSDWIGPFSSGQTANASHTWIEQNVYQIRVKAKDSLSYESNWSESRAIVIQQTPLETVLLIGLVSNLKSDDEYYIFNSDLLLLIKFNPFEPNLYSHKEAILISNEYFGLLLLLFNYGYIFGFFNAAVI